MFQAALLAIPWALAGSAPDVEAICASQQKVVLAPDVQRRVVVRGPCKPLVPSQSVADYMKAFAFLTRELAEPEIADQLLAHMEARWLWIREGSGYAVYDAEADAFVDRAVFLAESAGEPLTDEQKAAAEAYRKGYAALRAKRYDEAGNELGKCLESDPEHVGCHWELGWVHWVAEDWTAAAASWGEVEQREPEYPELAKWLAKARARAE